MEKMRLTLDDLSIQSFTTTSEGSRRSGTVHGHDVPTDQVECPTMDEAWQTCKFGCGPANTGDCSDICYSDACSAEDCSFGCDWSRGGPSDC